MPAKIFHVFMDVVTTDQLRAKMTDLHAQAQGLQAKADENGREMTAEELDLFNTIMAEFDLVEASLNRRERLEQQHASLAAPQARMTESEIRRTAEPAPNEPAMTRQTARTPNIEMRAAWERDTQRWGWGSFGEMAMSVVRASLPNPILDARLQIRMENPGSTIVQEGVGADGGFLVPPEFRTEMMERMLEENELLRLTDDYNTARNAMVFPTDETTPWQTSGGIQAYWEGEADQIAKSKVALKTNSVRLNKLSALIPVTEETLEDAPMIDSYLRRKTPEKFNYKINHALVHGTGAGMPLGLLKSAALVTVAKETGQAADTVVPENVVKMYTRMPANGLNRAVWLINQDVLAQIMLMKIEGSAGGVWPAFMPPGGLSAAPYGTLLGRPIFPTEACQQVGDLGDMFFVDLTQYLTAMKTGGIRVDVSMHIYFDYDASAFRFVLRFAGHPWWTSTIARRQSGNTNTLSPYVTLAARA